MVNDIAWPAIAPLAQAFYQKSAEIHGLSSNSAIQIFATTLPAHLIKIADKNKIAYKKPDFFNDLKARA